MGSPHVLPALVLLAELPRPQQDGGQQTLKTRFVLLELCEQYWGLRARPEASVPPASAFTISGCCPVSPADVAMWME